MLNPSFDHVLKKGDNRYTLIMLTAKRARQIIDGSPALVESDSINPVTLAIEEIVEEKVDYRNPNIEDGK